MKTHQPYRKIGDQIKEGRGGEEIKKKKFA